ncbi:MAG: hypothetical protein QSU88_00265, partial [Candidatus Methanoperedens sp.]|nr:hypothetical protein [Candidatus Methanoperedens sp.]
MLVTIMALIFIFVSAGTSYAKTNIDQTRTIDLNKYYELPMNEVKAGDVMSVDLQVTSGSPIDVLLMKSAGYPEYLNAVTQRGTINYLADGSTLGTTSIKYSYKFPESGDYYLVIDNTDVPKGGGSPTNQVEIHLKVSVVTPAQTEPPKISGFEFILA